MSDSLGHKRPLLKDPSRATTIVGGTRAHKPANPNDRRALKALNPSLPFALVITGSSSNAGKTWLCERIIEALSLQGLLTSALKITRTHVDHCPRQNDGCGVCDDLKAPFQLITERAALDVKNKDTGRYYAAGATEVRWLIVDPEHMGKAVDAAVPLVPPQHLLIAEGNSFLDWSKGHDLAIMALTDTFDPKPSSIPLVDRVDAFVGSEDAFEHLKQWCVTQGIPQPATKIPLISPNEIGKWVLESLPPAVAGNSGPT